ncbi:MAG: FeoB-associated Cys-rich membrane protein [Erysipelotrichaceae bacterium]|jgi:phosphoheptose isomerase|nr:FeoB-associated Cys-rich membrane protein [Erysipelotrichaceae bacterium]
MDWFGIIVAILAGALVLFTIIFSVKNKKKCHGCGNTCSKCNSCHINKNQEK